MKCKVLKDAAIPFMYTLFKAFYMSVNDLTKSSAIRHVHLPCTPNEIWAHTPNLLHIVLNFTHNVLTCKVECSQLAQGCLVCFGTLPC